MSDYIKVFDALQRYGDFRPTSFDVAGLNGEEYGIEGFRVFLFRSRDSELVDESNFQVGLKAIGGETEYVQVHRFGHWLSGWFELILISPNAPAIIQEKAGEIHCALAGYPVLDDEDLSQREHDAADELWKSLSVQERVRHIRGNRSCFEFQSYSDMYRCVRGDYFCGDPELLL